MTTEANGRLTARRYGSDFIVDILRQYAIPYAAFNPGASFRGIHDSLVNYLGNKAPEFLECTHEEISVAIAHGYARATGKPMAAILHNVVGLQHATMAIYNAWCDRVPIILLGGTGPMSYTKRRPGSDWVHTALVQGNLVRDFVKWDDQPADLESTPESFARAYQTATTEPQGPVYVCYDAEIQEKEYTEFPALPDPAKFLPPTPPAASPQTLRRIAEALLDSESPVIVADRLGRSAVAYTALLKLADLLNIPVLDQGNRHNFPTRHTLALGEIAGEVLGTADFILALDTMDLYGALHTVNRLSRETQPMYRPGTRIAHVTLDGYMVRSWSHDFRRLQPTDDAIAADTSGFVPDLLQCCTELLENRPEAAQMIRRRGEQWHGRSAQLHAKWQAQAEAERGQTPIALSTLAAIVWDVIKDEPWLLTNGTANGWVKRLWDIRRQDQYLGKYSGGGLGYGVGAAIGAALAYPDRLCINLQGDGDFLFTPTALWTAAHHKIPLLTILVNNRSYYNSEEHNAKIAAHRRRPVENAHHGTRIEDPAFDFAPMARAMGIYAEGPISRSEDLGPALRRALDAVKSGRQPALIDVITQNR
ncbi:benzoylformate decarboxylase [mine drainage metagenome]|uniref:Benzoylformate decarboxylase n=1 Tax=mine drainage metagenome TaxID=410659 RepID=A0A1J5RDM9_9ZZZZ